MSTLRKTMSTSTSFDVDHVIRCTRPSTSLSLEGQRSDVIYCVEGGGPGAEANPTLEYFCSLFYDAYCIGNEKDTKTSTVNKILCVNEYNKTLIEAVE